MPKIADVRASALRDPQGFWGEAARSIDWYVQPKEPLDSSQAPFYRWFVGGELNTCHNCLDRHVDRGRGEQAALVYESPVTAQTQRFSYRELRDWVARFAGALATLGVSKGDRVLIYMPMIPEAIVAMLACARLGAVHSVVFAGFAATELATRIDDAQPKVVLTASCGIEPTRVVPYMPLLDQAIQLARYKPQACVVKQRPQLLATLDSTRDHDWNALEATAQPVPCVPVAATDPLYILYTSGTTGQPKGVVRDNGGHAVALMWSMKNIYDVQPGEVFWAASDIGWVVGHSYIVYAPLLHGNTTVLFEGKPVGTPDAAAFWRVIERHAVAALFCAPTAIRAIKKEDPSGERIREHDLSSLRTLFLAGERSDSATLRWAEQNLKVPAIDHWWQTETGWAVTANCLGIERLPVKHGSTALAAPGWDLQVVDEGGQPVASGQTGALVVKLPLPPGALPTLWNADERFRAAYLSDYPGFYKTADAGYIDADGYVFVMARTDDVINVAGHRLSTGAIEEVLASHPDVAECAVIGVADEIKGEIPLGFLVLRNGAARSSEEIIADVVREVRQVIGPVAAFKSALVVARLPKTRSSKILRGTMRKIAHGEPYKMPATIDDPAILFEVEQALRSHGYPRSS